MLTQQVPHPLEGKCRVLGQSPVDRQAGWLGDNHEQGVLVEDRNWNGAGVRRGRPRKGLSHW